MHEYVIDEPVQLDLDPVPGQTGTPDSVMRTVAALQAYEVAAALRIAAVERVAQSTGNTAAMAALQLSLDIRG